MGNASIQFEEQFDCIQKVNFCHVWTKIYSRLGVGIAFGVLKEIFRFKYEPFIFRAVLRPNQIHIKKIRTFLAHCLRYIVANVMACRRQGVNGDNICIFKPERDCRFNLETSRIQLCDGNKVTFFSHASASLLSDVFYIRPPCDLFLSLGPRGLLIKVNRISRRGLDRCFSYLFLFWLRRERRSGFPFVRKSVSVVIPNLTVSCVQNVPEKPAIGRLKRRELIPAIYQGVDAIDAKKDQQYKCDAADNTKCDFHNSRIHLLS